MCDQRNDILLKRTTCVCARVYACARNFNEISPLLIGKYFNLRYALYVEICKNGVTYITLILFIVIYNISRKERVGLDRPNVW